MIRQIVIGTLVTMVAVAVQAEMLAFFGSRQQRIRSFLHRMLGRFAATGTIITGVFYIMLINTFHVWLWASVYMAVGAFDALEPALYFSLVAFTTVGFGDVVLGEDWRLLSGMTAANGFLVFGWSAGYMAELIRRAT